MIFVVGAGFLDGGIDVRFRDRRREPTFSMSRWMRFGFRSVQVLSVTGAVPFCLIEAGDTVACYASGAVVERSGAFECGSV